MIKANNLTKFTLNKKLFSNAARVVLSEEKKEKQTISLAFISKSEMKKLNKKFRKKDKATDVLSFPGIDEIVICPEVVKNYGKNFKKELLKVFVHGVLHLCGYKHEESFKKAKEMEQKEKFYLNKIYV